MGASHHAIGSGVFRNNKSKYARGSLTSNNSKTRLRRYCKTFSYARMKSTAGSGM